MSVLRLISLGAALAACSGAVFSALAAPDPDQIGTGELAAAGTLSGNYLAARHAEYVGDDRAAADFMSELLTRDVDEPEVRRRAFLHLIAAGRVEEALPLAEDITDGGHIALLAAVVRAAKAIRNDDFDKAEMLLSLDRPGSLGDILLPMLQAWVAHGQGDLDKAMNSLSRLAEETGLQLFHDLHAALIYDAAGRNEKAETAYIRAMGDEDAAPLRVLQAYVSFLARNGRVDEAAALIESLEGAEENALLVTIARDNLARGELAQAMIKSTRAGMAEALFEVATAVRQERADDVALVLAQLALYMNPEFLVGRILVAELLEETGQLRASIDAYEKIVPGSPVDWEVRIRIADLLAEAGDVDEAIAQLQAIAEERTDRPEALIRLGHIFRSEERFAEAVAAYDQAAARIPIIERQHWTLLYARGIALERVKEWPRAEKDFLRALEFNPDQPFVLNYLGYSWVDQGMNLKRALEMIERAVELRPRDGYIVDSLGWALYRLGDFDGAVKHLEQAVELRPADPVINDHLGDAYWRVGRKREARFQWHRALSFDPEEEEIGKIESKLEDGLPDEEPTERES